MRKTMFNRLLLSYMPIFFIVVTFTFFVFFQLLSEQIRKETLGANKMLSQQAMRLIDTSLKAIDNRVMTETINNKGLIDFFNNESKQDVYLNISAVNQLNDMISAYPIIDSIYLVRFEDNFVLSNATNDHLGNYKDAPFIRQAMESQGSRKWSGVRSFEQFSVKGSKPVVSLVRGMPFITGEKGLIVVNVSTDYLRRTIADLYNPQASFIRILDASGNALFNDSGSNAQARVFSNSISEYTGWSYHSGLIKGEVFQAVTVLNNVWFMIGIAMIGLGFIWLVFVTRRHSRPFEQLVARLHGNHPALPGRAAKEGGDEFSFLESALETIIEQSNLYQQKHKEDMHLRTRYLFHQLIEGTVDLAPEEWMEESSDVLFSGAPGELVMLVVEMDKYNDFSRQYSARDQNLLKFSLRSVIQELGPEHELKLWAEWTSAFQLSVIVGLGEAGEESESRHPAVMLELFDHVRAWTQDHLKFTVTIGIGKQVAHLSDIGESYKAALNALKHKIALGENRLITSEHIASHGQVEVFSHLNAIRSIVQSFKMLDDEWTSKFDELFGEMKLSLLTKDEIMNLMNYFIYYMGREMAGMPKELLDIWQREGLPKLTETIENCHSLSEMREKTLHVLESLAGVLQEAQDSRLHSGTIREMRKFIEEQFANPNVSLEYLSGQFNINAKYVSKLFKEETGQKFVDFLIDVRLQHAQRLLTETQASVQEVAEQVGYTSAISFGRVFKKVVGCSPSEFREEAARRQSG
ncbi:helix-turn-helix domain-containing protein [Paenibacillus sp. HJGM_3]|uniref:helix-turn-helix domain-containing protein n=1 Tax=Paenibacillus sp. HJGM_3 TaxID=3379816 RepID=UPI00385C09A6